MTFEKGSPSAGVTVHPDPFNEAVCKNVRIRRRIQPDDFLEFFRLLMVPALVRLLLAILQSDKYFSNVK